MALLVLLAALLAMSGSTNRYLVRRDARDALDEIQTNDDVSFFQSMKADHR